MESSLKHIIVHISTFWNFEKISNLDPPDPYFFDILLTPTPNKIGISERFHSVVESWYFRTIIFLKILKHK